MATDLQKLYGVCHTRMRSWRDREVDTNDGTNGGTE